MEAVQLRKVHDGEFMPVRRRVGMLVAAWAIAYAITMPGNGPATILGFPWFALGICDLVGITERNISAMICLGTWLTFIALSVGVLSAHKRTAFFVRWAVLLALLIATAVGCHGTMHRVQHGNYTIP
jgi:hypothetical protein